MITLTKIKNKNKINLSLKKSSLVFHEIKNNYNKLITIFLVHSYFKIFLKDLSFINILQKIVSIHI